MKNVRLEKEQKEAQMQKEIMRKLKKQLAKTLKRSKTKKKKNLVSDSEPESNYNPNDGPRNIQSIMRG